ncbi:hypothetical protein PR048_014222 [Dryococelus australis]|uniref:Tc1-like transposase DDE domain-containing protein n=1 Tax=Dryococelus australis TaxID=614101 RepID=A0ABQ9HDT2_9NEOP|nr:hypothetical protein PR048_014222 [Dryococelus australis]
MRQRRNARAGETGDPRESPPTAASSAMKPTCENPGVARPSIEPGSLWWEASILTAHPPSPSPPMEVELNKNGEDGAAPEGKGGETRDPEKTRRPAASSDMSPKCENLGNDPTENQTRFAVVQGERSSRYRLFAFASFRLLDDGESPNVATVDAGSSRRFFSSSCAQSCATNPKDLKNRVYTLGRLANTIFVFGTDAGKSRISGGRSTCILSFPQTAAVRAMVAAYQLQKASRHDDIVPLFHIKQYEETRTYKRRSGRPEVLTCRERRHVVTSARKEPLRSAASVAEEIVNIYTLCNKQKLGLAGVFLFQQDNEPKHTAMETKWWLLYNAPRRLLTPPQSPRFNPVEYLCEYLGKHIQKHRPSSKEALQRLLLEELFKISPAHTTALTSAPGIRTQIPLGGELMAGILVVGMRGPLLRCEGYRGVIPVPLPYSFHRCCIPITRHPFFWLAFELIDSRALGRAESPSRYGDRNTRRRPILTRRRLGARSRETMGNWNKDNRTGIRTQFSPNTNLKIAHCATWPVHPETVAAEAMSRYAPLTRALAPRYLQPSVQTHSTIGELFARESSPPPSAHPGFPSDTRTREANNTASDVIWSVRRSPRVPAFYSSRAARVKTTESIVKAACCLHSYIGRDTGFTGVLT